MEILEILSLHRLLLSKRLIVGVVSWYNEHWIDGRYQSSGGEGLLWNDKLLHRYDHSKQGQSNSIESNSG